MNNQKILILMLLAGAQLCGMLGIDETDTGSSSSSSNQQMLPGPRNPEEADEVAGLNLIQLPSQGSTHHPRCKPCIQFQKSGGCVRDKSCGFCHFSEHDKPKCIGNRERHALQRKEYLESKECQRPEVQAVIDKIYKIPLEEMDLVIRQMKAIEDPDIREAQSLKIVHSIDNLGRKIHLKTPNAKQQPEAQREIVDYISVDAGFKSLIGRLHRMVRNVNMGLAEDERAQSGLSRHTLPLNLEPGIVINPEDYIKMTDPVWLVSGTRVTFQDLGENFWHRTYDGQNYLCDVHKQILIKSELIPGVRITLSAHANELVSLLYNDCESQIIYSFLAESDLWDNYPINCVENLVSFCDLTLLSFQNTMADIRAEIL